jgi:hypothetical protein
MTPFSISEATGGILVLPDALERSATPNSVAGCRVSGPREVESGALLRQARFCLTEIRHAGGNVAAIVGNKKAQPGKLSSGRPDLVRGAALAERLSGFLCFRDLTRLFRPAGYDPLTNPHARYSPEDFAQLREFVGPSVLLAVIVPLDKTVKELHILATKEGMKQARAEGRLPGRPRAFDERTEDLIICAYADGVSQREICRRYGLYRSTLGRFIDLVDEACFGTFRH